jgi:hypothetical protein
LRLAADDSDSRIIEGFHFAYLIPIRRSQPASQPNAVSARFEPRLGDGFPCENAIQDDGRSPV